VDHLLHLEYIDAETLFGPKPEQQQFQPVVPGKLGSLVDPV
jgi:hypothetical protein